MSDPDPRAARDATYIWFEVNSGWAPPDPETLADWAVEGACRAPDGCWVERRGTCGHGLVSWQVVLDELAELDGRTRPSEHGTVSAPT